MASVVFNIAKSGVLGAINLTSDDVRAVLCMTNTTADTEIDADTVSALSTLDESDATGYARITMAGEAVSTDDVNDRGEFDANDLVFSGMSGDATRDYQGVLLIKHVTNDTDSIPIVFVDFTADIAKAATQVTVPWDAQGILQLS